MKESERKHEENRLCDYNLEIENTGLFLDNRVDFETVAGMTVVPDPPLLFQNVIFTSFTFYGTWYWLTGISWSADPNCGAYGALFGSIDA